MIKTPNFYFQEILKYIRIKDWWYHILPPIFLFYNIGLLELDTISLPIKTIYLDYFFFFSLSIFTASFGFFVNEWTDIEDDFVANKKNALRNLSSLKKIIILFCIIIGILGSIYNINWKYPLLLIYCVQILLFILYSISPFRLKRNKYLSIAFDALYSGTLFYVMAICFHNKHTDFKFIILLFSWAFIKGVRNIILHLINDKTHDNLINFDTIATSNDVIKIEKDLTIFLLPTEIILFFILLFYMPFNIFFISLFFFFITYLFNRKNYIIPFLIKRKVKINTHILREINLFYEAVLPITSMFFLVIKDIRMIFIFILTFILFPKTLNWLKHLVKR